MKNDLQSKLQKVFLDLIKIDEIYDQEDQVIKYVQGYLDTLGIPNILDNFRNVIAFYPGTGEPILLNTHLDIPESVPNLDFTIKGNIIRSNGKSILGADPKSGLAVLLLLASHLKNNQVKTRPIEFVFTRGEETGLHGAINLDYSKIKSKVGLILDEDGPYTNVVIQAPGYYRIDVEFVGTTVHPRDWYEGANALAAACKSIANIKQGEIISGVTCNVGTLSGGTARNSVAGKAKCQIELRSFDNKKLISQGRKVENILKSKSLEFKVKAIIDSKLEFESYKLPSDHNLFNKLEQTYQKMHTKPNYYKTYGGSDANIFNTKKIVAVPIGSGYYLAHQYTEYVNLKDMEELVKFLTEFTKTA
ncbi:M20/M25/M40 family metallo-hydrolase [Candidatus Daviesbacteria bacterium]|nr:M20/M25/M40 family metallo-hydrolase [Candidatus Daviesbacteria bacterium]